MKETIISVGIDIGTSTTQLVFSEITLENTASSFAVPKITITDKNIIYKSHIHFTPLIDNKTIDTDVVLEIIKGEYGKAGIKKEDIKTGAVIITGETARKDNAKAVLEILSGYAGDFVVATAGPDLESVISAKGTGVDKYSENRAKNCINLDIGGGTTNIAVFKSGELFETACFDVGGRLIKFKNNKIIYINEKVKKLISKYGLGINEGDTPDVSKLTIVAEKLSEILEMSLNLRKKDDMYTLFITNKDLKKDIKIDVVSFSGGVADYIYNQPNNDLLEYGDIGILLGIAIKNSELLKKYALYKSNETIRATVVGAGSHTTSISGSTITYDDDLFPIKNLPVIKITGDNVKEEITEKLKWFEEDGNIPNVAISLRGCDNPSFEKIKTLAINITEGARQLINKHQTLVVVLENDLAKVLGQTIKHILKNKADLVCIDGIKIENGDYIDIGAPVSGGCVLPVVIKTLIFG